MSDKVTITIRQKIDMRYLELKVAFTKWLLVLFFLLVIAAYAGQFGVNPFNSTQETWGQFGDFVGGFLNPMVAFFAFYWLSNSVLLQKTELAETREALIATQLAQQDQAETALLAAQIQTFNIRLQSISIRLNQTRQQLAELIHFQGVEGPSRIYFDELGQPSSPLTQIEKLRLYAIGLTTEENELIDEIQEVTDQFLVVRERARENAGKPL